MIPRLPLGPHPCGLFALAPGLPLGSQPCNPFALVANPNCDNYHCLFFFLYSVEDNGLLFWFCCNTEGKVVVAFYFHPTIAKICFFLLQ